MKRNLFDSQQKAQLFSRAREGESDTYRGFPDKRKKELRESIEEGGGQVESEREGGQRFLLG
eukprot:768626-Hanusia_phi.AAC.11